MLQSPPENLQIIFTAAMKIAEDIYAITSTVGSLRVWIVGAC
jgi:hypothetical protein